MKTLVVGLGNPALGDDGVGWQVVRKVCKNLPEGLHVQVNCLTLGGLGLMEHLIGYDRAILVDAFATDSPVGSISVLKLNQLPNYSAFHIAGEHDTSLQKAIEMGKEMGAHLPSDIMVVGITTERIHQFSKELSQSVEQVVPCVVNIVLDLIKEYSNEQSHAHSHE